MFTHYIDIQIQQPSIACELHGRVVMAVHMSIVDDFPLAVDWPLWKEERRGFGPIVRLFGRPRSLDRVLSFLDRYREANLIGYHAIREVPPSAEFRWGYVRSRRAEKVSPSYRRRQLRRNPQWKEDEHQVNQRVINHELPLQSFSGNSLFGLKISRVSAEELSGELNNYGMAVAVPCWS